MLGGTWTLDVYAECRSMNQMMSSYESMHMSATITASIQFHGSRKYAVREDTNPNASSCMRWRQCVLMHQHTLADSPEQSCGLE